MPWFAKRRWFQFRLQTLFAVITLVALLLGWNLRQVQERQKIVEQFTHPSWTRGYHGGEITATEIAIKRGFVRISPDSKKRIPRLWTLLGAKDTGNILALRMDLSDEDLDRARALLPECDVVATDHPLKEHF